MSRWRSVWLVAVREVKERVRSRSFRFFTIGLAAVSALTVIGLEELPELLGSGPDEVGVVAAPGADIAAVLESTADDAGWDIEVVPFPGRDAGIAALRDGDIDALVVGSEEVVFEDDVDEDLKSLIDSAVFLATLPQRLAEAGLTLDQARDFLTPEPLPVALLEPAEPEPEDIGDRRLVAFLSAFVLYLTLAFYGNWVLTGVIEEKASRVVEVLLASLRPEELLAGKVAGIIAVAVLQVSVTIAAAGGALLLRESVDLPSVALDVAIASVVFFVMGLLFYNLLFAMAGSTASRQSEAQGAALPVTMMLLFPYLIAATVGQESPDSPLLVVMSLVPLTSALVMPTRIALGDPSLFEVVLAVALLAPSILLAAWLAGRVYAGAILRTRGHVNLLQAIRGAREIAG